jgi:uncharacterized protein YqiB (DUF1249 family)
MTKNIHNIIYEQINQLTGGLENFNPSEGYLRLKAKGFMDLHVERIPPDTISISHYYKENGDLISDPDMLVKIDLENQTAEALTFQNSYIYQEVYPLYPDTTKFDQKLKDDLNLFLSEWLNILKNQGFYQ